MPVLQVVPVHSVSGSLINKVPTPDVPLVFDVLLFS